MADYNIYIHSAETGGGISNPTTPWNANKEAGGGNSQTESWASNVSKAAGVVGNPDMLVGMSASKFMKAIPAIAAAYVVCKTASAIYETNINIGSIKSGDYTKVVKLNNFKATVNAITHPFSSTLNYLKQRIEWDVENERRTLERELLGDSVINSYSNRGV